jgi:hypothetical protein
VVSGKEEEGLVPDVAVEALLDVDAEVWVGMGELAPWAVDEVEVVVDVIVKF